MNDIKVLKFGGSSLADAEHFLQVKKIVEAEEARRYVVPSAPGRRFPGDDKVTDLLYSCYDAVRSGEDIDPVFDRITERYTAIIDGLGIDLDLSSEIRSRIMQDATMRQAAVNISTESFSQSFSGTIS